MSKQKTTASVGLMITLLLLAALPLLSLNMFLPSLGVMAQEFDVGYDAMALTISIYLLFTAVIQVISGPIADRFGRRPIVLIGLSVFILASIGCAQAESYRMFFIWRALQGGIATASVLSRAVVGDLFNPQKSASVLGYIAMGMSIAPIIGPSIGGLMSEIFGWRINFLIYCFCGLVLIALVFRNLPETGLDRDRSTNMVISSYITLSLSPLFWAYSLIMACGIAGFFVFVTGVPIVVSAVFGENESTVGLIIGSITCGFMVGSFLSGKLALKRGLDRMILYGRGLATVGLSISLILLLADLSHLAILIIGAICVGIGNGLTTPSASTAVMFVNREMTASASGLSGAIIVVLGAFATFLTGIAVQNYPTEIMLIVLMLAFAVTGLLIAIWAACQQKNGFQHPNKKI